MTADADASRRYPNREETPAASEGSKVLSAIHAHSAPKKYAIVAIKIVLMKGASSQAVRAYHTALHWRAMASRRASRLCHETIG